MRAIDCALHEEYDSVDGIHDIVFSIIVIQRICALRTELEMLEKSWPTGPRFFATV